MRGGGDSEGRWWGVIVKGRWWGGDNERRW